MKITKTASFFFLILFRMLLLVLLSVSKRGAVVISLENRSELPNRRSKEDNKKNRFLRFIASISKKLTVLIHFENVSFGIANQ